MKPPSAKSPRAARPRGPAASRAVAWRARAVPTAQVALDAALEAGWRAYVPPEPGCCVCLVAPARRRTATLDVAGVIWVPVTPRSRYSRVFDARRQRAPRDPAWWRRLTRLGPDPDFHARRRGAAGAPR